MKRKTILNGIITISAATFMVVAGVTAFNKKNEADIAEAGEFPSTPFPTEINLNDCDEDEIISYYSPLSEKTPAQLSGQNLLKNLKALIRSNVSYFKYDNVDEVYVITDRDWKNSKKEDISGYDSATNKIIDFDHVEEAKNNPYVKILYNDYALQPTTRYKGDGDVQGSETHKTFDKEHVWSQSHGFKKSTKSGEQNLIGAGSDLHHLIAGAQYGNETLHNNYSYGFVKNLNWDESSVPAVEKKNKRGTPLFTHSEDQEPKNVFEPQDCDKGDIARALLYMAAAYNNLDGSTPTPGDPALELKNYLISENSSGFSSEKIANGYYGALEDILAWHYMDPVDEYEIHRNNLIFKNYQGNRNPFIDYPEWVDYIWGRAVYNPTTKKITHENPSGYVDLDYDAINDYRENKKAITKMEITKQPNKTVYYDDETFESTGMEVIVTYDDLTTKNVTDLVSIEVDLTTVGTQTVTVKYKKEVATTTVTVLERTDPVSSVTLDNDEMTFRVGDIAFLTPTILPRSAANKNIIWSSSDNSVVTVEDGKLTGAGEGTAVVTATSESDSTIYDTCNITISGIRYDLSETTYELIQSNDQIDTERKIIVASMANELLMNEQTTNNRQGYEMFRNSENKTIDVSDEYATFTLEPGSIEGTYAFKDNVSGEYLYADGDGANINHLKSQSEIDEYASFSINITTDEESGITNTIIMGNGSNSNKYMAFTTPKTFSCYSAVQTGARAIGLYQQIEREGGVDISVTDIRLNKTSLVLNKGDTETLTAKILPADADNTAFDWVSTAPDVATINEEGLITAISVGDTTIKAVADDGGVTGECHLRVNSKSTGTAYYERITSSSDLTSGQYVIAANVNEAYYALPNSLTISNGKISSASSVTVSENKISTANAENYVVNLTVTNNTVSISNGTHLLGYNSGTNLKLDGEVTTWNLVANVTKGTFALYVVETVDNKTNDRYIRYRSDSQVFGAYSALTAAYYNLELFKYTEGEGDYVVDNFVADFLGAFTCDERGLTEPVFKEGWSWTILKGKYESLTPEEQLELTKYTANEFGNDEAKCVARYDYIVKKYGVSKYPNWMNRAISPNANVMLFKKETNMIFIFIVTSSLLALSIGSFIFFYKRKKKYN